MIFGSPWQLIASAAHCSPCGINAPLGAFWDTPQWECPCVWPCPLAFISLVASAHATTPRQCWWAFATSVWWGEGWGGPGTKAEMRDRWGTPWFFWPSCAGCVVLVQDLVLAYPHRSWAGHTCRHSCSSWTSVAMKSRARGRIWPLPLWSKGCLTPQSTGPCRLSKPTTTACTSVSVGGCRAQGMVIAKRQGDGGRPWAVCLCWGLGLVWQNLTGDIQVLFLGSSKELWGENKPSSSDNLVLRASSGELP